MTVTPNRTQPDIAYQPDFAKYNARTKWRLEIEKPSRDLPPGFPKKLSSPLVWRGSELTNEEDWTLILVEKDLAEINSAVAHFKGTYQSSIEHILCCSSIQTLKVHAIGLGLGLGNICQKTFPLASLGQKLRACSAELHNGKGFFVLRGFPVDILSREDCIIAYTGVSSYVGSLRGWQDQRGTALVHVTDLSAKQAVGTATYTNEKQVFHTDNGDIVALLAVSVAAEGGRSKIASSWEVYNNLVEERPDLVKTLSENWPCDRFDTSSQQKFGASPV